MGSTKHGCRLISIRKSQRENRAQNRAVIRNGEAKLNCRCWFPHSQTHRKY